MTPRTVGEERPRWTAAETPAAVDLGPEVPDRLTVLLAGRGIRSAAEAQQFLNPSIEQLHDPSLLPGMAEAVGRLTVAADGRERVAIVGDYDVDGVSATALLTAVLQAGGIEVVPILPRRQAEGYGLQTVHVEKAAALGCGLIVTVDCGSTAFEAVAAAQAAGLGVIVTDHHLTDAPLPVGAIEINPRRDAGSYPFLDLSGAGIAAKLAAAFAAARGRPVPAARLMTIACLGTIADMVPLVGENRAIAATGLANLAVTRSLGLQALIRKAGLKPPFKAGHVGFGLGPRINAAGRMGDADPALELLLTRDRARADELADVLERSNRERQAIEARVVEEARRAVLHRGDVEGRELAPILVAWSPEWHAGVLGIAAGRLAREFHRPAILLRVEGDAAVGSGRSIRGVHLHDFIARQGEDLIRFGGHSQAVGLTAATRQLKALQRAWEDAAAAWDPQLLVSELVYELELRPAEISLDLCAELARLEPYGVGNPQPLARIGPLRLASPPRIFGRGRDHLGARVRGPEGGEVDLVGWGWAERSAELEGEIEVLAFVERDDYRGAQRLRLADVRPLREGQLAAFVGGGNGEPRASSIE